MKSEPLLNGPLLNDRHQLAADRFVELRIWRVPAPVRGSRHEYRYALALVVSGERVLRYDNEPGKGDHRHLGKTEQAYAFVSAERLLADFWKDVDRWNET
jgi:hypothetical protein